MGRRIAVIGNSSFPLGPAVGAEIVDILRSFGEGAVVLTRLRPPFDVFVAHACMILGIACLTYDAEGGPSNIERDSILVRDCTEMHAFFDLGEFEQGAESGTGWLVEKALAAGKPVKAYASLEGNLIFVGSEGA